MTVTFIGLTTIVALGALGFWFERNGGKLPAFELASSGPSASTQGGSAVSAPVASPPALTPVDPNPSFDIVRVDPDGHTVIAGRALPLSQVSILDAGKTIGKVNADAKGEWVFVPDQPLASGSRELSLQAADPDGTLRQSESPVVLVVPDRNKQGGMSLAIKLNPNGSVSVLQGAEAGPGAGPVSIEAVVADDQGQLSIEGKATPGAKISIYLDNNPFEDVIADAHGGWEALRPQALTEGDHTVRVDQVGNDGKVAARAEVTYTAFASIAGGTDVASVSPTPLPRENMAPPENPGAGNSPDITIRSGFSLWRIARRTYGRGNQFMAIYQANVAQIRDPNLIYPGQVFKLPTK